MTDNNPRMDPVGTVRTHEGRTAVKAAMGDDGGKGGHVWVGITDGTVRIYHHADVRSWQLSAPVSSPEGGDNPGEASEARQAQDTDEDVEAWRQNRANGWFRDVGYALQKVLDRHRYLDRERGSKQDDPGWHPCTCGWEGYWSDFHPHVADHLRVTVADAGLLAARPAPSEEPGETR